MSLRHASIWLTIWVSLALVCGMILSAHDPIAGATFFNVYMLEKLLSLDNLFVFMLIFKHFSVSPIKQRLYLNWGILGAIVGRMTLIGAGVALISSFHWILYAFGPLLIYSGYKIATEDDEADVPGFIKKLNGVSGALVCIVAIELADLLFSLDSIPASLAVTQNFPVIYAANIFALLGLRSFYFIIQYFANLIPQLNYGIAAILCFTGVKMLLPLVGLEVGALTSLSIMVLIIIVNLIAIRLRRNYMIRKLMN